MPVELNHQIARLPHPERMRHGRARSPDIMTYAKLIGCGCIALLALGCGSKGDSDDDSDDTGGSSTGGTSSGGSSTGGSAGSGGSSGSGGALPVMTTMSFSDPSEVCPAGSGNTVVDCWKFVDSNADMATSTPIPDEEIEYVHTADDGDPEAGAFQATIPYTEASQWVSFGINFNSQDLTRRIIKARIKIAEGLGDPADLMMAPAGTKIYAKSGMGYCYANGAYFNQGDMGHDVGTWQTIEFNLLRAPDYEDPACTVAFDPADVREIGIQFDSNSMATTATTAVVLIDTVTF
jgi:hypothetical protein